MFSPNQNCTAVPQTYLMTMVSIFLMIAKSDHVWLPLKVTLLGMYDDLYMINSVAKNTHIKLLINVLLLRIVLPSA